MKKNNLLACLASVPLVLIPILIRAQGTPTFPTLTTYSNFKCEVYLEVYNGLYDWHENNDYSGGSAPLTDGNKTAVGAVTAANKNDTDGDSKVDEAMNETDVRPGTPPLGRNEVDLIKIVVKKVNPAASLSGNVTLTITGGTVKLWAQPYKGTAITLPHTFPASALNKTVYLEVLEPSTYQGIDIVVSFNGKTDNAKATAVWATFKQAWRENTATPVPGPGAACRLWKIQPWPVKSIIPGYHPLMISATDTGSLTAASGAWITGRIIRDSGAEFYLNSRYCQLMRQNWSTLMSPDKGRPAPPDSITDSRRI